MLSTSAEVKRTAPSQILPQSYNIALSSSASSLSSKFSINDYINYHTENEILYEVEDEISSSATKIIFVRSLPDYPPICLKVWISCNNGLYSTENLATCTEYLLEGLNFNRQFAEDICLGIAPIEQDGNVITCGKLIVNPVATMLETNVTYALVMKRLEQDWRLDHQLVPSRLGTRDGIEFLANEVSLMHQRLTESPSNIGGDESIASKLKQNKSFFADALELLSRDKSYDITKYNEISRLMSEAAIKYKKDFQQRRKDHHIRRCHGDLKAANLWICPNSEGVLEKKPLIALDCVDFNLDFCHIDTISDVAMLAIDIEMHLPDWSGENKNSHRSKKPYKHFLDTYLEASHEKRRQVTKLLEYYMTEKAMIRAYMCILFDKCDDGDGEKYLDLALTHAQKLSRRPVSLLKSPVFQLLASLYKNQVEFTKLDLYPLNLLFAHLPLPRMKKPVRDQASSQDK